MTVTAAENYQATLAETNILARRMVYLEEAAAEAYRRRLWTLVGELHDQREEVREQRSDLLRQVWQYQRRQAHRRRRQFEAEGLL